MHHACQWTAQTQVLEIPAAADWSRCFLELEGQLLVSTLYVLVE